MSRPISPPQPGLLRPAAAAAALLLALSVLLAAAVAVAQGATEWRGLAPWLGLLAVSALGLWRGRAGRPADRAWLLLALLPALLGLALQAVLLGALVLRDV